MSYDDFCRCTPCQFAKILEQWKRREESRSRDSWEQTRFLAATVLQPYSMKALKPTDVATFRWERAAARKPAKSKASTYERFRSLVDARAKDMNGHGQPGDIQNQH